MKTHNILYLIADFNNGEKAIEEALKAKVDYIQLREKNISSAEYLSRAKRLHKMTSYYHIPLIINDRIDIAQLSNAEGVHLGQSDVPVEEARKLLGKDIIIGATAKTKDQAVEAEKQGADYIGSGAWNETATKLDATPITDETYKAILEAIHIPSLAVGGLTVENCERPLSLGANGLAVSRGILGATDILGVIREFRKKGEKFC